MIVKEVANVLRKKGGFNCIQQAEILEGATSELKQLHLRKLDLDEQDIDTITTIIQQETTAIKLVSISFSYNQRLGDSGVTILLEKLPATVSEIGLVDCGIGDVGGLAILNWMRNSQNLQMICMEQNNFSANLKMEFSRFRSENPSVVVIF